jgi:nitrite reductase/ring-hydroxylating ferredoxin subunit
MPATVLVAPEERPVAGFALLRASSFYARGTAEQRESAVSLREMLQGLEETPAGAVEMAFLNQDAYLLGVRLFFSSVELEEYWLDLAARGRGGEPLAPADPEVAPAADHFFPHLNTVPPDARFEAVRGLFTSLGFKVDRAVTDAAPRVRAMYNADREEMSDKAIAIREQHARSRALEGGGTGGLASPALAVADRKPAADWDWGVDVPTGFTPAEIPLDSFRALTIGSVRLFITNYGGQLAAVSGSCTHQQTALAKGRFSGTIVECPRHGAEFDLRDGSQVCPPFCQRWMERSGMKGRILALVTPEKKGGDLPKVPLSIRDGEIVLRI